MTDYEYYKALRDKLRDALLELSANPAASVTVSTGDGNKAVTFKSLAAVQNALQLAEGRCAAYERAADGDCGFNILRVVWC